jgi:hypothetical protein
VAIPAQQPIVTGHMSLLCGHGKSQSLFRSVRHNCPIFSS